MATPYDANNTGGTLPLPKIHIPTWFTINSVSQYNDTLLDLDLLDSSDLTIEKTINDPIYWACGDKNGYDFIGTAQNPVDDTLTVCHIFDAIFLFVVNNNNQVIKYGIQINYTGWINYLKNYTPGTPTPMIIDGEYAKKEISREWWFDVLNDYYYIPPANYNDRQTVIVNPIWVKLKSEFETFDTVEDVYLFWEKMLSDEHCSEQYIQNIITENCTSTTNLYTEELYPLSPYGEITNLIINLGGSHIENYPYLVIKDSTTFDGGYITSKLPSSDSNNSIVDRILILTIHISIDYNNETFNYTIYIDNESHSQTYSFSWGQTYPSEKIISVVRLADEAWPDVLANIVPSNTVSSVEEAYTLIDNNWPSPNDFWDIITNEEYLEEKTLSDGFVEPIETFPITIEQGSKDIVTIGNTPPKLGSIIAYSHPTEFLPDTNSSHVLYFKNAELKSFNFAVQNNTVIDRIEKLYRYAGPETNLTTEFEDPDVDPKNMIINEETANVPENTEILVLIEGSVVTSV